MPRRRADAIVCLLLLADALLFFAKPLFLPGYSFPWDFRYVQVPLISFLADQLHAGQLPLWDPYTYCGNPIYANIQACFFHPLVVLAALVSNAIGPDHLPKCLEWIVVLQVWAGACSAYFLLRHLGASRAAAWAGGAMCVSGPFVASRAEHIGALMAVAWMPLAWLAVLRMNERPRRWFPVLSAALAMSLLAGLPAVTLSVFGSTLALAILAALLDAGPTSFTLARWKTVPLTAAAAGFAILLTAVQFFPTAQLTAWSVAQYRLDWLGTGGGLKLQSLVSLIAPNHYGIFDLRSFHGPGDPSFLYLYTGLFGMAFALAAIFLCRDRKVWVFTSLAALGAFCMLGDSTPLWRALYPLIPHQIRIAVHPEYSYCIFAEALAILAALGLSRFGGRPRVQWAVAVVMAADLYLVGSGRPMNTASLRSEPGLTRHSLDGSAELLNGVRALSGRSFPPARIDTSNASIDWAECAPLTRVPTGNGASPLALERIMQVRLGLHPGGRAGWYYPVANPQSPALDLQSERFLLAGDTAAVSQVDQHKWRRVADLPGNSVFANGDALPRAFLVSRIEGVDLAGAVRFVRSSSTATVRNTAVVEGLASETFAAGGRGSAQITRYEANALTVVVDTPQRSYLVLTEAYFPGWEATVDGKSSLIYLTNAAFRGMVIEEGKHTIRMRFRPRILITSFLVSAAACAAWLRLLFTRGGRAF